MNRFSLLNKNRHVTRVSIHRFDHHIPKGLTGARKDEDISAGVAGREFGTTASLTNATDRISEPLEVSGVPVGEQEVVFTRNGYAEARRKIVVNRGETAVVDLVRLERLFIPDVEVQTRTAVYRGVYVSKSAEFYRMETNPGLTMSIPIPDIVAVRLIREENVVQDNAVTNTTEAAGN